MPASPVSSQSTYSSSRPCLALLRGSPCCACAPARRAAQPDSSGRPLSCRQAAALPAARPAVGAAAVGLHGAAGSSTAENAPRAQASGKFVHAAPQPSVSSQSALAVPQRLAGGASIDHDPRRDLLAADRARIVARVPLEPPALVHCGRRHRGHGRASADSAAAARRRRTRRWRRSSSSRRCCCRWDLLARLAALGSAAVAVHAVARLPAVHVCVCVRCLAASHAQATLLRLLGPGLQHVLLNSENPTRNRIPLDRKSRCGIPPSANSRALVVRAAASAESRCRAHRAVPRTPR
jgi:hypothetical protein